MLSNHVANGFLILENLFDLLGEKQKDEVLGFLDCHLGKKHINVWENVPYTFFCVPYKRNNVSFLGDFYLDFGFFWM